MANTLVLFSRLECSEFMCSPTLFESHTNDIVCIQRMQCVSLIRRSCHGFKSSCLFCATGSNPNYQCLLFVYNVCLKCLNRNFSCEENAATLGGPRYTILSRAGSPRRAILGTLPQNCDKRNLDHTIDAVIRGSLSIWPINRAQT